MGLAMETGHEGREGITFDRRDMARELRLEQRPIALLGVFPRLRPLIA
jgi:hypothetical protein